MSARPFAVRRYCIGDAIQMAPKRQTNLRLGTAVVSYWHLTIHLEVAAGERQADWQDGAARLSAHNAAGVMRHPGFTGPPEPAA